jgi:sugar phosphate isomerase/epimerase
MAVNFQLGLVTYEWAKEWDLPTLLKNMQDAEITGVELRVDHKHNVSPALTDAQRADVARMFGEAGLTLVGLGTNFDFHHPDPAKLRASMEGAKQYIRLGHDIGGTGVKVKPNDLPKNVPVEQTIAQIARCLAELGEYGEGFGQQIRLEVHGHETSKPAICKQIMEQVKHPNVAVCWNCNPDDPKDPGLEANFNLLKPYLGETTHIHELDNSNPKNAYPWPEFFTLLKNANYQGWTLLECASKVPDPVAAIK